MLQLIVATHGFHQQVHGGQGDGDPADGFGVEILRHPERELPLVAVQEDLREGLFTVQLSAPGAVDGPVGQDDLGERPSLIVHEGQQAVLLGGDQGLDDRRHIKVLQLAG